MTNHSSNDLHNSEVKVLAIMPLLMCVMGAVFYSYEYLLRVAPSVMEPELKVAFGISDAGLGSLAAFYYYAYTPLQLPVGLMMDKWGPRRILTLACFACLAGTYIFGVTDNLNIARLGRFMVGFGSAFAYVGVLKIAALWLPSKFFAMVAGFCTALGMIGAISGQVVMAKLVDLIGWRYTLSYSSYFGLGLAVVLWLVIRDRTAKEVTQRGRAAHHGVSLWRELLAVIKTPILWHNGLIGCLAFLPLTIFAELWATPYLQAVGLSKYSAALGSSIVFLGFGIGGPIWGALSDYFASRRLPLMYGSALSALIAFVIVLWPPKFVILLYLALFGCGLFASAQILVFAVGNDVSRPGMNATTTSFTNMIVMLGGMFFQPLVGFLLDWLSVGATTPIEQRYEYYRYALLLLPIGLCGAALLSYLLRETYALRPDSSEPADH